MDDGVGPGLEALREAVEAAVAHQGELARHIHVLYDEIAAVERRARVATVMDWIARAQLATSPLVSVVMPTRNRAALLARAVASVLDQSYRNWELLIVDDGSDDDTPATLAALDDPRIRVLSGVGRGAFAARNVALHALDGQLVVYLDDDNELHPEWLRSVVWAFEQRPDADVLYGALVVDDLGRARTVGPRELPSLHLHRFDREALSRHNTVDMGAIAHRAGHPEGRFDESLLEMGDWELFVRLTREHDPLELPAVACYYRSDAPDRLTGGPTHDAEIAQIQRKHTWVAAP